MLLRVVAKGGAGIGLLVASLLGLLLGGCSPFAADSHSQTDALLRELDTAAEASEIPALAQRTGAVLMDGLNRRRLDAQVNAAWQIMHGVIPYGLELQIDTPDRGLCGAIDYAFHGGTLMGFELMAGNEPLPSTGRIGLKARLEPGSYIGQGHVDQWLAIFAMANIPLDSELQIGQQQFTLLDWARQAQYDVTRNLLDEYSWTLIAMTHYFPDEPRWLAADGREVSWEDLVSIELDYDLDTSPCGGAHRLVGIARALQSKQRLQLADSPTWQLAQQRVEQSLATLQANRSATGALSSYYFTRAGRTADLSAELASAGHLFEVAAIAMTDEQLEARWLEQAAERLCTLLEQTSHVELECGALYHALHGLKIYRDRRFPQASSQARNE